MSKSKVGQSVLLCPKLCLLSNHNCSSSASWKSELYQGCWQLVVHWISCNYCIVPIWQLKLLQCSWSTGPLVHWSCCKSSLLLVTHLLDLSSSPFTRRPSNRATPFLIILSNPCSLDFSFPLLLFLIIYKVLIYTKQDLAWDIDKNIGTNIDKTLAQTESWAINFIYPCPLDSCQFRRSTAVEASLSTWEREHHSWIKTKNHQNTEKFEMLPKPRYTFCFPFFCFSDL